MEFRKFGSLGICSSVIDSSYSYSHSESFRVLPIDNWDGRRQFRSRWPDQSHLWIDGSGDRTRHLRGWKVPENSQREIVLRLRFDCAKVFERKPHNQEAFTAFLFFVSSYIFCRQETLWIFFCRKLIWSEPNGLLLCLREARSKEKGRQTSLNSEATRWIAKFQLTYLTLTLLRSSKPFLSLQISSCPSTKGAEAHFRSLQSV